MLSQFKKKENRILALDFFFSDSSPDQSSYQVWLFSGKREPLVN